MSDVAILETETPRRAVRPSGPLLPPSSDNAKEPAAPGAVRKKKRYWLFLLFAVPNLTLIAIFSYWPVIGNLLLSLADWDMISPSPTFVGLENYKELFSSDEFLDVMGRTLTWVLCVVAASLGLGLGLALLFGTNLRGSRTVSAMAFTPHVISGAAIAAVWLFIFDPNYGLSRLVFSMFGADSPQWTTEQEWAMPALIIVAVWKGVGFVSIVYLAALQGVPKELLEAAQLDGANKWQVFKNVVWPMLSPTTFFLAVTQIISAFQSFDLIAMMTSGGPAGSTTTLSWFIYEQGFKAFDMGTAAASSMIMFVILLVVTGIQMRFAERKVHYS